MRHIPMWYRALLVSSLVILAGCEACKSKDRPGGLGTKALNASGATFQQAFQEVAIEAFMKTHAGIRINYAAGGSGKGRQDFSDQIVDFACTDAPYRKNASKPKGGEFFYIPNLLGPIAISYNLPVEKLQLSGPVLARIFDRQITRWNDPAIAADNPGVTLPDRAIVVARRAEGSGTTENFTRYLELAAPGVWKRKSGATIEWPNDTRAGQGNSGVAQLIASTVGAIGYVDLSDAKATGLAYAAIRNKSGTYILPTSESASRAAAGVQVNDDLTFSALDPEGDDAYPITAQSWCLIYKHQTGPRGVLVKDYFRFMLTDAQALMQDIDYAPLPEELRAEALAKLEQVVTR